jgi:predicted  nucleic acid-binding Zn-ribbon protein
MAPPFRSTLSESVQSGDNNITVLHDLHRSLLKELDQSSDLRKARNIGSSPKAVENGDIVSQLETLVELVENSQNVIDVLAGRIKTYEELIYDLKSKLCEESAQKEAAYQRAAKVEIEVRALRDRVDAAEARANIAEEEVKQLESREAAVKGRLSRLTSVIRNLAAASESKSPIMALAS